MINTLLICGGGSSEHEVSLRTADFIEGQLAESEDIALMRVEMDASGCLTDKEGRVYHIFYDGKIRDEAGNAWDVDYVIPAIHGYPGETGDLQSQLEMFGIPYFGSAPEASKICFNKIKTKMWLSALGIDNTPYLFLHSLEAEELSKAHAALEEWEAVFIKASNQGSSVGCFKVSHKEDLEDAIAEAFTLSSYVLVEKALNARELEVAVYTYGEELIATHPGEVRAPADTFYTYKEKYAAGSRAETFIKAEGLSEEQLAWIQEVSIRTFKALKLKDLSRIDFFLTDEGELYLNEVNTFPGMTPNSMFPKMMQNHGHDFTEYLTGQIRSAVKQSLK
ncbi:D-alanine--D-alanine ligase [Microbulbifer variabilis]|uniref:D-alanine--D-alanine ligase n=1 Tax=Microbulbifer variabilis TaxID=266805 RepID=A0ABY4VAF7_9GAMM|nr:D-alanine--D-alanine ligase [Microbulbifer variabilis]USD20930.1 D-alanine--D-alanine ligase [Microbulbifer variabilis]